MDLSPVPLDVVDEADASSAKEVGESARREVEVVVGAANTAVDDSDGDGLVLVSELDLTAAGALGLVAVVELVRDGGDVVAVLVAATASAEAGVEPGD